MSGAAGHAARQAAEQARADLARLEASTHREDLAAGVIETWQSATRALQAFTGSTALTGQALVKEARGRDLLTLGEAHAIVDLASLAERAVSADYAVTAADRALCAGAVDALTGAVHRGGPAPKTSQPVAPPPAASEPTSLAPTPSARSNALGKVVIGLAAVALLGALGWLGVRLVAGRTPRELMRARAAFAAGNYADAVVRFTQVAQQHPTLAEPHLYLGRMARQRGDIVAANQALRQAVALEPNNYLTHRELASLLLVSRRPDLARAFYERAIRLNPTDQTSLGYMGCAMAQLGRGDLAQRFTGRAGPGPWSACSTLATPSQALPR